MIEVLCVILGWALSLSTIYIRDLTETQNKRVTLLVLLVSEITRADNALWSEAKSRINSTAPFRIPHMSVSNRWWDNNKMTYMLYLPNESELFDRWNEINETIDLLASSKPEITSYVELTKETKNNLEKSLKYWQQPWYKILFHRLRCKQ